ncbi:MAG: dihydropyrimidinase [Gluconobacter potus]|uniref:Dihydropyrimidinase n=1 Tax=Gluconobacter potus TaxID=2724927 RepID=A0ABR9YK61_9PROT|nr:MULTISPECIES: dihydropyrimidinase [Gluconobacter]MBF0864291.1 dihydropyrimidinase [Gluconobacter sp. R71656]MBF0867827.1 dihydropyrimidinase [Gluconobacter sp. R75628]MBF0872752.1 dihydropyrimidinase [Gluconobacter sp. R75629]MBF0881998.1 dihydropyrimidinase [Gluconobacter potus]
MTTFDIVIRNGMIVTATDKYIADIGINGSKIVDIGFDLKGHETIDATGLLVLPGGIDGHCHIEQEEADGTIHEDDFVSATGSALLGGTTTVVCFASHVPGRGLVEQFDAYRRKGANSRIDFAIHQIITRTDEQTIRDEIPVVAERGAAGLKVFMTYDDFHLSDGQFLQVLEAAHKSDILVSVHCENYDAIRHLILKHLAEGRTEPHGHVTSRPPCVEREATYRAMTMSELTHQKIQIFHVSCPEVAEEIGRAQSRGVKVVAETCPHYLTLTEEDLKRDGFEGTKYICSPPLRTKAAQEGMWQYIRSGVISIISSDHCGYTFDGSVGKGRHGRDADFSLIPNGMPGLGTRLPVFYDAAINSGKIDLTDFVRLTATTPAQRYGLYPQKGTIAPGSDADLVLWDPKKSVTITNSLFQSNIDYTPYEGRSVQGWPVKVYQRGKLAMDDGKLVAPPGSGQFLKAREK